MVNVLYLSDPFFSYDTVGVKKTIIYPFIYIDIDIELQA